MYCFVHFFRFSLVLKLLKLVKIWQSCSQIYTATLYKPQQKCTFLFFHVRCAHKSGDVVNFIIVACRIYSLLIWYNNYKNRLRLAKVIVKNKMLPFYGSLCIIIIIILYYTIVLIASVWRKSTWRQYIRNNKEMTVNCRIEFEYQRSKQFLGW